MNLRYLKNWQKIYGRSLREEWLQNKECLEKRHGESFKFLFLKKTGIIGSQARNRKKMHNISSIIYFFWKWFELFWETNPFDFRMSFCWTCLLPLLSLLQVWYTHTMVYRISHLISFCRFFHWLEFGCQPKQITQKTLHSVFHLHTF